MRNKLLRAIILISVASVGILIAVGLGLLTFSRKAQQERGQEEFLRKDPVRTKKYILVGKTTNSFPTSTVGNTSRNWRILYMDQIRKTKVW